MNESDNPGPGPLAWLASAAALALSWWPSRLGADVILANPLGESDNHLWMFSRATRRLWGDNAAWGNVPVGVEIPLMDPVNLPWFAMGAAAGPGAAWALMLIGNIALAMGGTYALARCFCGRIGALLAAVIVGCAPFLVGVAEFGITESWPMGWAALHMALLIRYARGAGPGHALGAGLALGAVALSGWYQAFFGLVLEAMLVPVLLWRTRRVGLLLQGGVAMAMVAPSLLRFLEVRDRWSHRWLPPAPGPPGPRPDWADLPVHGTDLLNLFVPHLGSVDPPKASYLGVAVLALVGVGLVRRTRVAAALVGVSLPFLVLALGYWPTVAGWAVGMPGPAYGLVKLAPAMLGLSHWERAVGAAVPLLAVAAGVGLERLPRPGRWLPWVCLLVAADGAFGGASAWPRQAYTIALPAGLEGLAGTGGVVQLPFDNGRAPFSRDPARLYNRWQVLHGRPVAENYEGIDALLAQSTLVGAADTACMVPSTLPPYYQPPPSMRRPEMPTGPALQAQLDTLSAQGFEWFYMHAGRCRGRVRLVQLLDGALGPGERLADGDIAWPITGKP